MRSILGSHVSPSLHDECAIARTYCGHRHLTAAHKAKMLALARIDTFRSSLHLTHEHRWHVEKALHPVLAQTDLVLTNEVLETSNMIDTFLDYAFIYDGGIKRHWIVYNIHAIKANDLDILAQQLAAEHEVEHTTMLRALLAMVSCAPSSRWSASASAAGK